MTDFFQAIGVDKRFDGVRALHGASFSLASGEVHALMGENGAGKSTLAKAIAGAVVPDRGSFAMNGSPVSIGGPRDAQRLGIGMIYQELDLFPHLTIAENLAIGNPQIRERGLVRPKDVNRFAAPFLNQVGLTGSPAQAAGSLSTGERQLVAIARALSMKARIILMDEPTSSLFEDSVSRLFQLISELKQQGVAIVYVSHKMDEIFRICDRVTVMRDGETVGTRGIGTVSSEELIGMMIGRAWQPRNRTSVQSGGVALSFSRVSSARLRNVSFQLTQGEVLGIAGLQGSGRSDIGAVLVGLERPAGGKIFLGPIRVAFRSVKQARDHGVRFLPEDRKLDGLMMQMSVLENGTLCDLRKVSSAGCVNSNRERTEALSFFKLLALKSASLDQPVEALSGGNQQKVLLSRCLMGNPDVIFLDEPTRGVDVGAKEDIYRIIGTLASQGKAILMVSSEIPELLRCCDKILVMREGSIAAELNAGQTSQEEILSLATRASASSEMHT